MKTAVGYDFVLILNTLLLSDNDHFQEGEAGFMKSICKQGETTVCYTQDTNVLHSEKTACGMTQLVIHVTFILVTRQTQYVRQGKKSYLNLPGPV